MRSPLALVRPNRFLALGALTALVLAACATRDEGPGGARAHDHVHQTTQALEKEQFAFTGQTLATDKTLALTFDDGPAADTPALLDFLKAEKIPAAFFVNGQWITGNPDKGIQPAPNAAATLKRIVDEGHLLGNHTTTHASLPAEVLPKGAAAVVKELEDTDKLLATYVTDGRFTFRAPYGAWSEQVWDALKGTAMNKYVGPIAWDMGGFYEAGKSAADFDCWQTRNFTTKQCGDLYLKEIRDKKKGVVLLHDQRYGGAPGAAGAPGNSVDMVKYIVAELKKEGGWSFVRLDEVPAIKAALPPPVEKDAGADAGEEEEKPKPTPTPSATTTRADAGDAPAAAPTEESDEGGCSVHGATPPRASGAAVWAMAAVAALCARRRRRAPEHGAATRG